MATVTFDHVTKHAAQRGDVGVQGRSVVRGSVLAIHGLQQSVDGHRLAGRSDEDGEHGSLLGATHEEHPALVGDDVKRTQHAVPHGRPDPSLRTGHPRFTDSCCARLLKNRSTATKWSDDTNGSPPQQRNNIVLPHATNVSSILSGL